MAIAQFSQSPWQGLDVRHAPRVAIDADDMSGFATALDLCAYADTILLCLGEAALMSGEAASRANLSLPGRQQDLADAVFERAARKPVVVVLFSGCPLAVPELVSRDHAVLAAWFPGCEAGHSIAAVLTGKISPCGRTPVSLAAHGKASTHLLWRATGWTPLQPE